MHILCHLVYPGEEASGQSFLRHYYGANYYITNSANAHIYDFTVAEYGQMGQGGRSTHEKFLIDK
jgi:hypothetical protein